MMQKKNYDSHYWPQDESNIMMICIHSRQLLRVSFSFLFRRLSSLIIAPKKMLTCIIIFRVDLVKFSFGWKLHWEVSESEIFIWALKPLQTITRQWKEPDFWMGRAGWWEIFSIAIAILVNWRLRKPLKTRLRWIAQDYVGTRSIDGLPKVI